ncbi:putative signal transduction response regulator containing a CheY-like receiver domain and a GGDEF domain [Planktothrix sp. PCC 11201]|uniref:diguanylate cyclase n=1 Tax=Planktothrix sp. PCC 11201 TaxID=1729650 RepID=UPI0009127FBE|nr:diguanylate cyclase [Planktothrix sp. PCC 11201]SKB14978.1 putative signal transduction response regulator containing a CheY-like receiver domain and a GGDEF domain [Planktothrix sp. PCC 11201]
MDSFIPEDFCILIVDDITNNLKLVGKILDDVGYNTTFATSGFQALNRLKDNKIDLILLDLMMPEMDGLEVCQFIKNDPKLQEIPIIFLTASYEEEKLIRAFELGAVDYITKPFIKNELLARVKTHLTLKQTTDNLKIALLKLQQLSQLDPLTQILNRRSFFEYIENQFNLAIQNKSLFSLLILDLDHFKQINDNYGHLTGDQILINFTLAIQNYLRASDYFGRYGGEEFVILLPETDQADALKIAQDICDLIAHLSIPTEKGNLHITVSIGVAVFRSQDTRIEDIFDRADQCLYQAKALGRNTCYAG